MVETQQLVWNPTLNRWQEQTISTLDTARQIPAASVTYRPGASVAGFVYDTFLGAVDAINASNTPTTLYVDGSVSQPVVPSGVYNLGLVALAEMPGQTNVSLNLEDGVKFNLAPSSISGGLSLYSFSSSPIIDQGNLTLFLKDGSWLQTSGSAPFIHVGLGALAQIFLSDESYLAGSAAGSTAPIVSSDGYSTFTGINVGNWADVGLGALDGYGAMEVNLISSSGTIAAQPNAFNLTIVNANVSGGGGGGATADYSNFFALMPGDNSATVAVGAPVQFPQDGPSSGVIVRMDASSFKLPAVGTYEITWQVSVAEPGQLQLAVGGVGLPNTVVGRATGTSQIVGSTMITTVDADSIVSVISPAGNSTALTITPVAGGASPVSATLSIRLVSAAGGGGGGAPGPQGPQGVQGVAGATGARGATGQQGATGPQGPQGLQGTSATGASFMGPQGLQGSPGATGLQGPQGSAGLQGQDGAQGSAGLQGLQGPPGSTGSPGSDGATGPQGPQGAVGMPGSTGPQGQQGSQGPQGIPGAGSSDYSLFYALMPGDNSATVAVGDAIQFPQDGATTGFIARINATSFNLPAVGDYEVSWQASIDEAGQLQLALDGIGIAYTVVGRAMGTDQISGHVVITTTSVDSALSVINPVGNSTALTITPIAGGTNAVSATLFIRAL